MVLMVRSTYGNRIVWNNRDDQQLLHGKLDRNGENFLATLLHLHERFFFPSFRKDMYVHTYVCTYDYVVCQVWLGPRFSGVAAGVSVLKRHCTCANVYVRIYVPLVNDLLVDYRLCMDLVDRGTTQFSYKTRTKGNAVFISCLIQSANQLELTTKCLQPKALWDMRIRTSRCGQKDLGGPSKLFRAKKHKTLFFHSVRLKDILFRRDMAVEGLICVQTTHTCCSCVRAYAFGEKINMWALLNRRRLDYVSGECQNFIPGTNWFCWTYISFSSSPLLSVQTHSPWLGSKKVFFLFLHIIIILFVPSFISWKLQ